MKKTFNNLMGEPFDVELTQHDISKYDVLFHVTPKVNRIIIEEQGLLLNQPTYKTLGEPTGLLFMSYPVDKDTSDCFRWSDEHYALIVLDAEALHRDGFIFYDDYFSSEDRSSKRNHLCVDKDIPAKYIKKVIEFTSDDEEDEAEEGPAVVINTISEPKCDLFHENEDLAIGTIDNMLSMLDVCAQIKRKQLTGYFFIFKHEKIIINSDGSLDKHPEGFYDKAQNLLNELIF